MTSYALSSVGRAELKNKYKGIKTVDPYILSFTTPTESLYKERISFEHKKVPMLDGITQDIQFDDNVTDSLSEEEEKSDDENLEKLINDQSFEISVKINDEMKKYAKIPFENRINDDIIKNIYQIVKNELVELGDAFDFKDDYIETKLDEFLFVNN